MNSVSTIPAPVAAEISGTGSFFGSCQIASGNFEAILQEASNTVDAVGILGTAVQGDSDIAPEILGAMQENPDAIQENPDAVQEGSDFMQEFADILQNQDISGVAQETADEENVLGLQLQTEPQEAVEELLVDLNSILQNDEPLNDEQLNQQAFLTPPSTETPKSSQVSAQNEYESKDENESESKLILQLKAILGEDFDAETFNRIVTLIEKGSFSVQKDMDNLEEEDFALLGNVLLESLENAVKQLAKFSNKTENSKEVEESIESEALGELEETPLEETPLLNNESANNRYEYVDKEKFLNILTDLLNTGIITPQVFEQIMKNPEESNVYILFGELIEEVKEFLAKLENHSEEETENFAVKNEQSLDNETFNKIHSTNSKDEFSESKILSARPVHSENHPENHSENRPSNDRMHSADFNRPVNSNHPVNTNNSINSNEETSEDKINKPILNFLDKGAIEKGLKTEKTSVDGNPEKIQKALSNIENSDSPKTAEKFSNSHSKAEPEIRAAWEGGELKIELVNPKTGEKLQEIPTTGNMPKAQERMNEFEVVRQVIAQAKFITTPTGEQKLTIRLNPEHLGQLDLRIILNRGEMQIHAKVESATAQQALENHIGLLREGLEKQGIALERLEISIEQREKQDSWSLAEKQERHERQGNRKHNRHNRELHLAVSARNENADTGRRLGYNTMEYLA